MSKKRKLSRRSFLTQVAGGASVIGAAGLTGCATTGGPGYTGQTDADSGPYADAAGYGRNGRYGGGRNCTDADQGPYADPANQGRNCRGQSGYTDADQGPYADPPGQGRGGHQGGYTDADQGPYADPPGQGRGGQRGGYTDSDQGPYADPPGQGRGGQSGGYTDNRGRAMARAGLITLQGRRIRTFRCLLAARQNGQKWRNTTRTGVWVPTIAPTAKPQTTSAETVSLAALKDVAVCWRTWRLSGAPWLLPGHGYGEDYERTYGVSRRH